MLPAYALAAVPVADCALSLTTSVRPSLRPVALTLIASLVTAQTISHNVLIIGRLAPVAVLVRPRHRPPAYARTWTPHPLPGLRSHHGYRVYLSPR
ncbi:hypothetical protein IPZ61_02585 [Streptomyces sioyaensis]|uniref:hypothetical protein n=1 Tax=Streptomyces sioyaensis TaxID=67364 RepID=UPI001F1A93BF|nr:hypothetical protein [Streptomyces sioyaensis]MCF3172221.1 hypothetical protein [Streptomyces sioyaensis]